MQVVITPKEDMDSENKLVHVKAFEELIYDAVQLIYLADKFADFDADELNLYYYHTLCRSSIMSTSLLFECAANCCIDTLDFKGDFAKDVDKLAFLSKFELFLSKIKPDCKFDRGCKVVQGAQEIKGIRDSYVHPKVKKYRSEHPNIFPLNEASETPFLKIPRQMKFWKKEHSIKVLKAANAFFNAYFLEWCAFDTNTVCGILLESEKCEIPAKATVIIDCIGALDEAVMNWGIDFKYIGKKL